jgi:hypothetical protein
LYAFKVFAIQTNEIFLLVAEILSRLCISADRRIAQGMPLLEALHFVTQPFHSFVRNLWWDVAIPPKTTDRSEFIETLKTLVQDCWDLLDDVLKITAKGYDVVLNAEYISRYCCILRIIKFSCRYVRFRAAYRIIRSS